MNQYWHLTGLNGCSIYFIMHWLYIFTGNQCLLTIYTYPTVQMLYQAVQESNKLSQSKSQNRLTAWAAFEPMSQLGCCVATQCLRQLSHGDCAVCDKVKTCLRPDRTIKLAPASSLRSSYLTFNWFSNYTWGDSWMTTTLVWWVQSGVDLYEIKVTWDVSRSGMSRSLVSSLSCVSNLACRIHKWVQMG